MSRKSYPSDVSDEEWAFEAPIPIGQMTTYAARSGLGGIVTAGKLLSVAAQIKNQENE